MQSEGSHSLVVNSQDGIRNDSRSVFVVKDSKIFLTNATYRQKNTIRRNISPEKRR